MRRWWCGGDHHCDWRGSARGEGAPGSHLQLQLCATANEPIGRDNIAVLPTQGLLQRSNTGDRFAEQSDMLLASIVRLRSLTVQHSQHQQHQYLTTTDTPTMKWRPLGARVTRYLFT